MELLNSEVVYTGDESVVGSNLIFKKLNEKKYFKSILVLSHFI